MSKQEIDWYERRHELAPGMVFKTNDGVVRLVGGVEGDATKWEVDDWYDGSWSLEGTEIEPGDLMGSPIEDSASAIAKAVQA